VTFCWNACVFVLQKFKTIRGIGKKLRYLPAPHGVTWRVRVPECVERQGHFEFNPNIFLGFVHGSRAATVWPAEWPAGAEAHAPSWPPSTPAARVKMLTSRPRDLVTKPCTTDSICKSAPRNKLSAFLTHSVYWPNCRFSGRAQTGRQLIDTQNYRLICVALIKWTYRTADRRHVY
jgi:hypothetical protein